MLTIDDSFTPSGAAALADKIRKFWTDRGFWPDVWVAHESNTRFGRITVVRSNIRLKNDGGVK